MARPVLAALLVSVFLMAGCSQDTDGDDGDDGATSTAPATTAASTDPCPQVDAGSTVPGWTAHGARWGRVGSMEGHIDVVCGEADGAVQSLVEDGKTYGDLEAWVSFDMLAGDSGAGLVIHFADDKNFNIVRYSIREQGWHLFTMIDGDRVKQENATVAGATTDPELNEWVRMRVVSEAGHVKAWDGETLVIDYELEADASHEGGIGYFLRDTGMAALFDDFSAESV